MKLVWLAAGAGTRMGTPKVLMQLGSEAWLTVQLRALRGTIIDAVVLVVDTSTQERVRSLAPSSDALAVNVVVNPDPSRGPLSSLQVGLDDAPCFVSPIDVPAAVPDTFLLLRAAVSDGASAAIPTFSGRGGHPVLLGAALVAAARDADPARDRLDHLLRAAPGVARVPVADERVVKNLNTPEDLQGLMPTPK